MYCKSIHLHYLKLFLKNEMNSYHYNHGDKVNDSKRETQVI